MNGGIVERYLRLGLQLDRHVEGTVDAYFGPPDLAAEVQAAAPVDPAALVACYVPARRATGVDPMITLRDA